MGDKTQSLQGREIRIGLRRRGQDQAQLVKADLCRFEPRMARGMIRDPQIEITIQHPFDDTDLRRSFHVDVKLWCKAHQLNQMRIEQ